jgi:hypothetical protein
MWVRCSVCQARRVLNRHPDRYLRLPRCRTYGCTIKRQRAGKRQSYYVDHYRQRVERNHGGRGTVCRCAAYHFPHRRESGSCQWRPPF